MKRALILSFLVALIFGCTSAETDYSDWLAQGVLVDTRTVEEYNAGHAPNAVVIPYEQMVSRIDQYVADKQTPILLYCRSGRRAGIAEQALKDQGYEKVYNVGGLEDIQKFLAEHAAP